MTTHYLDIHLLRDPEFGQPQLLGALISKLHRALVQQENTLIGISFPEHIDAPASRRTLGSLLRLHGHPAALGELMSMNWLRGMRDHVEYGPIAQAPADAQHRVVQRRQFKTNAARLRRRRMHRHEETIDEAQTAIPDTVEQRPHLPYVQLRSSSTGQPFCLFIEHGLPTQEAHQGNFNTYGLSASATIPWF